MFRRSVEPSPIYDLFYEDLGQMPDVHATAMQTDLAAEVNIATMKHIAETITS